MDRTVRTKVIMSELRENLSAYIDAVENGATITVTRRGKPSATLSVALGLPDAIDLTDLQRFRDTLGVDAKTSAILQFREHERY